ncbi:MAG: 5-formyltetrahydrofolate cyclo-ligase [Rhodoluna sp.]|jgi:5-formyltetrahydrofolate cyclo-ligase
MNEIAEQKAQLREQILSARKLRISNEADLFTQNLLKVVAEVKPKRVAIYQAYKSEPQTAGFIKAVDLAVLVPITVDAENLLWQNFETKQPAELNDGDLVFIPALAVDKSGNRLGRGKAYFDRALGNSPAGVVVYAVIFEEEYLDQIPIEVHDRKVAGVVSEAAIHKIN